MADNGNKENNTEPELIRVYLTPVGKPYSTLDHLRLLFPKTLSSEPGEPSDPDKKE